MKLPAGSKAVVEIDKLQSYCGSPPNKLLRAVRIFMDKIPLRAVVATLSDVADRGLCRGQVGTVVEVLAPGVYEVEFSDDSGRTYALVPLRAEQIMVLHHQPVIRAA